MKRLYVAVAVFLAVACGSAPTQIVTGAPGHRDVLFDAEIQTGKMPGMNVYDLIAHLRPEFLRSRGANSVRNATPPTAVVYLNGMRYGSLEQMKSLSADGVFQIQYLSAADAQTRFGMDHTGGAILITSK
jgi:hypothetical protein